MEIILYALLICFSLLLYPVSNKLFFFMIPILYSVIAQSVQTHYDVFGVEFNMPMIYGLMILFICIVEVIRTVLSPTEHRFDRVSLVISIFLFYLVLSTAFSIDRPKTIVSLAKMSTWLLVFLVSRRIFMDRGDLETLSYCAIVLCFIMAATYILSRLGIYGGEKFFYEGSGILVHTGKLWGSTGLALPLVMAIPLVMVNFYSNKTKLLCFFSISLAISIILLSYLRSAIVMLFVGYLAFLYFIKRYKVARISLKVVSASTTIALLFVVFLLFEPTTALKRWERPIHQIEKGEYSKLASGRVGLFQNALDYYLYKQSLTRKIFGNGLGTSWITSRYRKVTHNDFLEILLGCGVIGFGLYVWLLCEIYRLIKNNIKSSYTKNEGIFACIAIFSFFAFLTGHFRGISQAVLPLSLMAMQIGATVGLPKGANTKEFDSTIAVPAADNS